jgi:hypothetical protein
MAFSRGYFDCLGHVISLVSTPRSAWSGVLILVGRRTFLQNEQTHPESHSALHLRGNRVPLWDYNNSGVMITTNVHLMLGLQWSYTLLPLSNFITWNFIFW